MLLLFFGAVAAHHSYPISDHRDTSIRWPKFSLPLFLKRPRRLQPWCQGTHEEFSHCTDTQLGILQFHHFSSLSPPNVGEFRLFAAPCCKNLIAIICYLGGFRKFLLKLLQQSVRVFHSRHISDNYPCLWIGRGFYWKYLRLSYMLEVDLIGVC